MTKKISAPKLEVTHFFIFVVIPGAPLHDYETEQPIKVFLDEEEAERYAEWWIGDQGRKDTTVLKVKVKVNRKLSAANFEN